MTGLLPWFASWLLMIVLLYALSRNKAGHAVIYYGAWLLVVFLLVYNNKEISALFQAGNITGQQ